MRLQSKIYTNEEQVGTITMDEDGKFSTEPADSELLNKILQSPVFVSIGSAVEDVHADKDPVLFMEGLASHYKSQGLRATVAENLDNDDDALDDLDVEPEEQE